MGHKQHKRDTNTNSEKNKGTLPLLSNLRNQALKYILLMAIGVICLASVWTEKGPLRFVALPGILLLLYGFVNLLRLLPFMARLQFPAKVARERKSKFIDGYFYGFSVTLCFVGIFFLVFQIGAIENTVHGMRLFWRYSLTGLGVGILLAFIFRLISPTVYDTDKRRFNIPPTLVVGGFLFAPAMACFLNRNFSNDNLIAKPYFIEEKSHSGGMRGKVEYFLFCNVDGKKERFTLPYTTWTRFIEHDSVVFYLEQGWLGYDYVRKFGKPNENPVQQQNTATRF